MVAVSSNALRRARQLLLLVLAATILGAAAATWLYIIGSLGQEPAPFLPTVAFVMPFWYMWALYVPFVVWIARQRPIERGRVASPSLSHVGLAVALSFVHTATRFGLQPALREALQTDAAGVSALHPLLALAVLELPFHVFIYGAILGVTYVIGYYRRLRERELAATRLSAQLAQAQMQALRMQLNPHFLFNALNSIAMLVRDSKRDTAVDTLEGLGDLLRYVLEDSANQEVKLQHEIEFIRRYLAIEQIRFQDRLAVEIDADHDTLEALVPNLVLQPIVENAIRHGTAGPLAASTVTVAARTEGGSLRLSVVDDGPGFSSAPAGRGGTGLGIANTRKRLAQMYGERASLEVKEHSPHGAAVTIILPFHTVPLDEREPQ
ncbi:MAG: histidine kinase [Gemmatimonadota bacterium]|nr:MAG: histidine kinase [Gemmatimonadota bacterium]